MVAVEKGRLEHMFGDPIDTPYDIIVR